MLIDSSIISSINRKEENTRNNNVIKLSHVSYLSLQFNVEIN